AHRGTPGESTRTAVAAAEPGDPVLSAPAACTESVSIPLSDVTLRGSGAGRTVLVPGTGKDACAEAGNGICVTGTDKEPLKDVSVRALTLRGYEKNGLWATRTEKLEVRDVTSEKNGQWGIAEERSVRSLLRHNVARDNGDA